MYSSRGTAWMLLIIPSRSDWSEPMKCACGGVNAIPLLPNSTVVIHSPVFRGVDSSSSRRSAVESVSR